MNKKIKVILKRLHEIHAEKEPFLLIKPLSPEEPLRYLSLDDLKKCRELGREEDKLLARLEQLLGKT